MVADGGISGGWQARPVPVLPTALDVGSKLPEFIDGANIYAYATSSPIMNTDREGRFGPGGAVVSMMINAGFQFGENYLADGHDFWRGARCINVTSVIVAGGVGFVLPGGGEAAKSFIAALTGTGSGLQAGSNIILFSFIGLPYKTLTNEFLPPFRFGSSCECTGSGSSAY